ncbi:DUF5990 family protein [Actinoplanes sp. NPDC049596]|uniref:DUF5990 family protein n=1 Tax=unclassified Actinoplanes TaxID=2626549 RepID=UPI00341C25D4
MQIRIEGSDLPGAGAGSSALRLANVHVGMQRKKDAVLLVPAWAPSATWEISVDVREVDGLLDVGGPWVHGRPGARFLYLTWGNLSDSFEMFRRAKLMFGDVPTAVLRSAYEGGGVLVGSLGLTDAHGDPVCARVRPSWSVE